MAHEVELEKTKYRNWVRGALAYKYLKQGIEGFADDVVQQEHNRILQNIIPPGQTCNQCKDVRHLRPKHASAVAETCPQGQSNCSCQDRKKKPCPNQVCDAIMGDILDSHGSQPPTPYWKNAEIQKWCSDPWEVAKCFINSPGYADKKTASYIDATGLLHIFINNTKLHSHLSCAISKNGTDVFSKVRRRRNQIFHSPKMELDQNDLYDCIADIITILEDAKELKQRPKAKTAVEKLKELKHKNFIITTNNEVEVCRDAMVSIANRSDELKEMIENAKNAIDKKATEAVDDKTQKALGEALGQLEKQNESQLQAMNERLKHVETDNLALRQDISLIKQQLCNLEELTIARNKHTEQLEYVEKKQALQRSLVERYETKGYFKTWISPLITQQNNIDVNEIYVTPNMKIEKKSDELSSTGQHSPSSRASPHVESEFNNVVEYPDIFQTKGARHKKIYIIGDVGTGKSTLSKMMIFNWCRAIKDESTSLSWTSVFNIREMSKFDFLFTIPLQRMSGFKNVIEMLKALYNPNKDVKTNKLMTEIFNQESERCLVIVDGLDEWTPPKDAASPQHVSYGIPVPDGVNNATLVTLSRPSAKGILNMKLTEYDQKIKLLGVHKTLVNGFVSKYMELNDKKDKEDERTLMKKISQTKLEHLTKTPLILQQLVWMYCTHGHIGKSVADIYSNIVNIIFGWFENKEEDITQPSVITDGECEQMQLPELLRRFPRCKQKKRIILSLGKLAFKACTEVGISTFGRSGNGLSKYDIDTLVRCGILVEHNCHDPTIQKSSLSFIHISYLEFFAALYISGHYRERYPTHTMKPKLQSRTVLKKLFMKIKSVEDILQLSNILRMVCGLSPFLLEEISDLISKQLMRDESMIRNRHGISQFYFFVYQHEAELIHNLISNCLLECGTDDKPAISLCDVIIIKEPDKQILTNIVTESVVSVNLMLSELTTATMVEVLKLVSKFHRSQFIRIYGIRSCEACKHLSSFLSQAVSLKQLELSSICCDRYDCEGHAIDLSKHIQLNSIVIVNSSFSLLESVVNTKSVVGISISEFMNQGKTPHGICEHLSSWLTQAVSLKQLKLIDIYCDRDDCDGHVIDLSKHGELQSIEIQPSFFVSQAMGNAKSLKTVLISNRDDHKTPHGICEHLSFSLSQAVSIKKINLWNITCHREDCEGHTIDLSKHEKIKSIDLVACSFTLGSMANAKSLKTVFISGSSNRRTSHAICEHLSSSLSQAVSITKLQLGFITCHRDDCEGHAIDLSKHHQIQSISLVECSFTLVSMANAKSLKNVFISGSSNHRTSHAICEHLSSSLSQAVSIKEIELNYITCHRDDCEGHAIDLSKHDKIQSIKLDKCSFTLGFMTNAKSLKTVSISGSSYHRMSHSVCEHLASSLSQAVSLVKLELRNITCDRDDCEGHAIDLSKHNHICNYFSFIANCSFYESVTDDESYHKVQNIKS